MDTVDETTRSAIMSKVRSKGNRSTERRLSAALAKAAISGWRVCSDDIHGKPDFFFPEIRLAVFVDGCFWHGCPKCYRRPKSKTEYWDKKLKRNQTRDAEVNTSLHEQGVNVMRFWECEVKSDLPRVVGKIKALAP